MATAVNRMEFLNLLETVGPGLSTKDVYEQSSCYIFQNGWLMTFNGEIACRIKSQLPPEIEGAIDAAPLLGVLQQMTKDEVELEVADGELQVFSGRKEVCGIRMQAEVVLPLEQIERPAAWIELPEDFSTAVEIVQETAKGNKDEFLMTVVHFHPKWIESCDRFQATRYKIKCGHDEPFLIRQKSAAHVVRFGMHKMSTTENWVHFKNPAGLIFSTRRYVEEYHDLGPLFGVQGEPAVLPKGAKPAAALAGIFSGEDKDDDRVTVELTPGRMRVKGIGTRGWARRDLELAGYKGEPVQFRISPAMLTTVVEKYNECVIGGDKLLTDGEHWKFVTVLGPVDKTAANGKPAAPAPESEAVESDDVE